MVSHVLESCCQRKEPPNILSFFFSLGAVISPPVTGTALFSSNSTSHEQINGGRTSPGCRGSSGLEANPGKLPRE